MCTVTFLPSSEGYILTSNRDEDPGRSRAHSPSNFDPERPDVYFPKDPVGSGSWIAFDRHGKTICLLNGGKAKHKRALPYRHSRGLVTLAAFDYKSPYDFQDKFNLERIEPFTLVWIEADKRLYSVVWDSQELSIEERAFDQSWIWSSVTLYDEETRALRRKWFRAWRKEQEIFEQSKILQFHHFGGTGDSTIDLKMSRPGKIPKTISITSIERKRDGIRYLYEDLLNESIDEGWI
jgi:uncharacterized protein with NRDE domain